MSSIQGKNHELITEIAKSNLELNTKLLYLQIPNEQIKI